MQSVHRRKVYLVGYSFVADNIYFIRLAVVVSQIC